jgi:uncharacterized protein (DUF1501 family)
MHQHCQHHDHHGHEGHGLESARRGSRIEDGAAHTRDHLYWSRRDFLTRMGMGVAGASIMLNGSPVRAFGHAPLLQALKNAEVDRILVLIQLNGGNDALNTIVPYEIDEYYRVRPTIAIPRSQVIALEKDHGMHPAMTSLTNMWNNNRLAAILNTGYRSSTRSHFEGTVNWATGSGEVLGSGDVNYTSGVWGRYVEDVINDLGRPLDHPMAVLIGGPVSLFQSNLGNLGVSLGDAQFIEEIARRGLYDATDSRVNGFAYGRPLKYVRSVANAALSYVSAIQRAANEGTNLGGLYPAGFGDNLSAAARLIRGGLGAKVISVSIGGFDTHSNQGGVTGQYADRWRSIADSVAAFYQDLAVDGLDQKVLTMTYSEFGRTLGENGSRGTDHGAGASMLLFGPGLKRGVYGTQSDLITQLYGGDPQPSTDFRSVYATVLQDWFGMPPAEVDEMIGSSMPRMDFIQSKIQVSNESAPIPEAFQLSQNYPNPFNPTTNISYTLNQPSRVTLQVFDTQGRLVRTLVDAYQPAGAHQVAFEGGRIPSGTYFYTLKTPDGAKTRSMVFMK